MNPALYQDVDIREVGAPIAAGSSIDGNSDRIDMAGYEGVIFVAPITDSADTGVATLTVEQNSADSDSGMAALSGAVATATSGANDDLNGQLLIVEVHRPRERYVQAVRTSGVANIAYGTVTAILYGARKKPISDHSTVLASATVTSPAEA
jgi:hypothetical protein